MKQKISYIGNYDVLSHGKVLLEILTQLRGLGVGRYVTRHQWQRQFPDHPSYIKIIKVVPEMDRWLWHGVVYGDWVYRGHQMGIYKFAKELFRPDWHLIHRHEEEEFKKMKAAEPWTPKHLPVKLPLPPLLQHIEKKKSLDEGKKVKDEPIMIPAVHYTDLEDMYFENIQEKVNKESKKAYRLSSRRFAARSVSDEETTKSSIPGQAAPGNQVGEFPAPKRNIYDVDPEIYLDSYGQELPAVVDLWLDHRDPTNEHWHRHPEHLYHPDEI